MFDFDFRLMFAPTIKTQQSKRTRASSQPSPEILTTIFEFACCPDDGHWLANVDLNTQKNYDQDRCSVSACAVTPLFIGAICSAWRSIAWGTPQLWTSITLLYNDDTAETLAEMLDYWLSKSGELPFSVTLVEDDSRTVNAESFEVIDVIAAYARRLHALDLFLPERWGPALARVASCTPLLTRLTLCLPDNVDQYNHFTTFADAPQLRELTLSRVSTADVALPWAQLESLKVDWGQPVLGGPPHVLLRHTALEALDITGFYEKSHPELFKVLELPALRSFVLHINIFSRGRVNGARGYRHSSRMLRKLVLPNFFSTTYEGKLTQRILDLLNPTKYEGLEHEGIRQLDGEGGGDGVGTTGLDEWGIGHCPVPNLETFEYEGKINFTPHALVEFLVARWRHRHPPIRCTPFSVLDSPHRRLEGSGQHGARGSLPPNVVAPSARLRSVTFKTPKQIQFEGADAEVIRELRLEGMHLEFSKLF
ncbi:hypothetical protein BJ912DRAFT_1049877 [Pholiota molesta]|nr:hypothetical protein BJ912DRAFT_1049877 [Pholiota molesta]